MSILIVGGRSSLASALKPVLTEFADVMTAGRGGCDLHIDLADPAEQILIPPGVSVVINAAADFGGKQSTQMLRAEEVNVLGALKLCQACSESRVEHLIQISTVFASLDRESPFYGIYSVSKRHADEVVDLYCSTFGLPLTILRPSQIYGVGDKYRKHQPFLFAIMDKAAAHEDIAIYGSNDALRNFIHVEDVARIIALIVQGRIMGTFPCVNSINVRYSEVAKAAIEAFHSNSSIRFLRDRPDIPDNAFDPDEEIYRLTQYYPRISISRGMQMEATFRKQAQ